MPTSLHESRRAARSPLPGLALLIAMAPACSAPKEEPSLNASDPAAQNAWIARAVDRKDNSAVPGLIELLDSSDPAERLVAIGALRSITGERHGYRIADPPGVRAKAVDCWVQWWKDRESRISISPPSAEADTES